MTGAEALYADLGHFGRCRSRGPGSPSCSLLASSAISVRVHWSSTIRRPRESVLPAHPATAAASDGRARDGSDGHRVAGGHHRGVLGHASGRATRIPAAAAHRAHVVETGSGRSTCRSSTGSCSSASSSSYSHSRSPAALAYAFGMAVTGTIIISTTALPLLRAQGVAFAPLARLVAGGLLPRLRGALLRCEPHEAHPRRVAAARDRRHRLHDPHDLVPRTPAGHSPAGARGRTALAFLEELHDRRIAVVRVPGAAVFLNRSATPLHSRCAPASSTSTRCTNTS